MSSKSSVSIPVGLSAQSGEERSIAAVVLVADDDGGRRCGERVKGGRLSLVDHAGN